MQGGYASGDSATVTWSPSRPDRVANESPGFVLVIGPACWQRRQALADQPSQHIGQDADGAEVGGAGLHDDRRA